MSKRREFPQFVTAADLASLFNLTYNEVRQRLMGVAQSPNQTYELTDTIELIGKSSAGPGLPPKRIITPTDPKPTSKIDDPTQGMSAAQVKTYYQGLVAKEDFETKHLKNQEIRKELMRVEEVEIAVASAFRTIVNFLDILPDQLERDGFVTHDQIPSLLKTLDKSRTQLANDLSKLNGDLE